MKHRRPPRRGILEKAAVLILAVFGIAFAAVFLASKLGWYQLQNEQQKTTSELISTKEIATLSVSEFVYNGIAQKFKDDGTPDCNVLYKSTVKVSVDADGIEHTSDDENKIITFTFPEFRIGNPVIDVGSISTIPSTKDLHMDEVIKLCRKDALAEANKSGKLISSAEENLKSIVEAWYSPIFEGYTFEYQFGTAEGGEGK